MEIKSKSEKQASFAVAKMEAVSVTNNDIDRLLSEFLTKIDATPEGKGSRRRPTISAEKKNYLTLKTNAIINQGFIDAGTIIDQVFNLRDGVDGVAQIVGSAEVEGFQSLIINYATNNDFKEGVQ